MFTRLLALLLFISTSAAAQTKILSGTAEITIPKGIDAHYLKSAPAEGVAEADGNYGITINRVKHISRDDIVERISQEPIDKSYVDKHKKKADEQKNVYYRSVLLYQEHEGSWVEYEDGSMSPYYEMLYYFKDNKGWVEIVAYYLKGELDVFDFELAIFDIANSYKELN